MWTDAGIRDECSFRPVLHWKDRSGSGGGGGGGATAGIHKAIRTLLKRDLRTNIGTTVVLQVNVLVRLHTHTHTHTQILGAGAC